MTGFVTRIGLAIASPHWALAGAADRAHAGRSGSDLIAAIGLILLATRLRGLAAAAWLGVEVSPGFGLRAALKVLTDALAVPLMLLVIAAAAVFAFAGARRSLGRAFDVVCVALVPLLIVDLVATVGVRAAGLDAVPGAIGWLLSGLAFGWLGALVVLAIRPARHAPARVPPPPPEVVGTARRLGWAVVAVIALGIAIQSLWIARHVDLVRPVTSGDEAPALALPEIGPTGELGERVTLEHSRGKITVLDFWATWCRPCLAAMPELDRLARANPDVVVLAINLDDPAAARALFTRHGYTMKLVAGDDDASQRYGVSSIPHTVILDRDGMVREVVRGATGDLAALVETIRTSSHASSR